MDAPQPVIAIIPGSNRTGSLSVLLARVLARQYADLGCPTDLISLDLEADFLDPSAYKSPAPAVTARVDRFLAAQGIHFIVPEYNGSFPGVLKLYLDMLPYPGGFDRRPCAFVGHAAGQFKGLRAVEHLQGVAGYRNAYCYPERVFIGDSFSQYDAQGQLKDAELTRRLQQQAQGFLAFVRQHPRAVGRPAPAGGAG
jgi:chromate reductase